MVNKIVRVEPFEGKPLSMSFTPNRFLSNKNNATAINDVKLEDLDGEFLDGGKLMLKSSFKKTSHNLL
jgi:hypothetical protein